MKEFCKYYTRFFVFCLVIIGMFTFIPMCFQYHGYVIETGSMEPLISTGSVVYVKEGDIQLNDIVTYQHNGKYITHRVVGIDEVNRSIITKGDANRYNDEYKVAINDVVGKVEYSIPMIGMVIVYLQSLEGKITATLMTVLFFVCSFYSERKKKHESKKI